MSDEEYAGAASPLSRCIVICVACLAWVTASSGTILINKHIMVELGFSYPGAVAAVGMLGTTIVSMLACLVFKLIPCKADMTPTFYFKYIMPTGFFMALTFQSGNLAYLYLSGEQVLFGRGLAYSFALWLWTTTTNLSRKQLRQMSVYKSRLLS